MSKQRGERIDTGRKTKNGRPIYNWVKKGQEISNDKESLSDIKNDFQCGDSSTQKRTWSQQEADYEIEKLEQIEKVLEDIESLPNDITDKVNKIAETTPLQKEGNRKYHVLNLHDPHHIVNIEIQGDRDNLNEDYHHWDVRFKKAPEITFNKENIKKAFHFDDISGQLTPP